MTPSPESKAEPSKPWNANLNELGPISEESHTREPSASPEDLPGDFDYFDFVNEQKPPKRSPTYPFVPPGPSKEHILGLQGRASNVYRKYYKHNYAPPVSQGKVHTEPNSPGLKHILHASTIDTNNSASFEDTAVWDQKAILSLGIYPCQTPGTSHSFMTFASKALQSALSTHCYFPSRCSTQFAAECLAVLLKCIL